MPAVGGAGREVDLTVLRPGHRALGLVVEAVAVCPGGVGRVQERDPLPDGDLELPDLVRLPDAADRQAAGGGRGGVGAGAVDGVGERDDAHRGVAGGADLGGGEGDDRAARGGGAAQRAAGRGGDGPRAGQRRRGEQRAQGAHRPGHEPGPAAGGGTVEDGAHRRTLFSLGGPAPRQRARPEQRERHAAGRRRTGIARCFPLLSVGITSRTPAERRLPRPPGPAEHSGGATPRRPGAGGAAEIRTTGPTAR